MMSLSCYNSNNNKQFFCLTYITYFIIGTILRLKTFYLALPKDIKKAKSCCYEVKSCSHHFTSSFLRLIIIVVEKHREEDEKEDSGNLYSGSMRE